MTERTPPALDWLELLNHTSRSFAIGIQALRAPLDRKVGLCYLLCRLLDTYEDSTAVDGELRLRCLERSRALLGVLTHENASVEPLLADWEALHALGSAWRDHEAWELRLLTEAPLLWQAIAGFSLDDRRAVAHAVGLMLDGMVEEIRDRQQVARPLPRTLAQTDQYCFHVAGTVGLLLSHFFRSEYSSVSAPAELPDALAIDFGKALQLVNIAKDFHDDWRQGRCYWPGISPPRSAGEPPPNVDALAPRFAELAGLFETRLANADAYMREIAERRALRPDIHFFCALPLEMARATMALARADQGWLVDPSRTLKIPREETLRLMQQLGA